MIGIHKYAVIAKTWEIVWNVGISKQWRTQKISEGAKFRHNRVTSQINFRGSAEGTPILGGPRPCPRENFGKLHLKIRIFVHSGSKF